MPERVGLVVKASLSDVLHLRYKCAKPQKAIYLTHWYYCGPSGYGMKGIGRDLGKPLSSMSGLTLKQCERIEDNRPAYQHVGYSCTWPLTFRSWCLRSQLSPMPPTPQ